MIPIILKVFVVSLLLTWENFVFVFVILQIIQVLGDKYPCYLGQYMYSERSEKDFFAFVFRFLQ